MFGSVFIKLETNYHDVCDLNMQSIERKYNKNFRHFYLLFCKRFDSICISKQTLNSWLN